MVKLDNGSATYAYDYKNRRYKRIVGSTVTHYVWEGSQVVAEYDGNTGSQLAQYGYAGTRMIAKSASGTAQYFLNDRLSARLALSGVGAIAGRQAHLPFGEDFGESGSQEKHHFTGYELDSESGLDYAINRSHSRSLGRFQQADPYQASGGISSAQSWNRYAYSRNDPINRIDPLGLQDIDSDLVWDFCGDGDAFPANLFLQPAPETITDPLVAQREQFLRFIQQGIAQFLQDHPNCQDVIDLAAQEAGSLANFSQLMDTPEIFVDTTNNPGLLSLSLGQLGFPSNEFTEQQLMLPLAAAFAAQDGGRRPAAFTNDATGVIYFGPGAITSGGVPDRTIVHEMLHSIFRGDHADVANRLGLKNPNGAAFTDDQDELGRSAVNDWLDAGCPNNIGL